MIEMRDVRQIPNESFRRWFYDEHFDLVVWYNPDDTIDGFELSYDKTEQEKALRWLADEGISHYRVDSGEQKPTANRTPMLVAADGKSGMARVLVDFAASEEGLPADLTELVRSKLREYGNLDSRKVGGPN